jgi:hypothetical protein
MKPTLLVASLVACSGDTSTPVPDADPNAPLCTGVAYDNCQSNDQCDSANCHLFEQNGFRVCTQACSAANPCPMDSAGVQGTCNDKGICKPTRNNACRPE